MSDRITIHSRLRDYDVEFVEDAFRILGDHFDPLSCLIVDKAVHGLFAERLQPILGSRPHVILEATEKHKSYDYCGNVIQQLLNINVRKNTQLVAVGGGVVQDLVAFCASIMFRGIEWAFVPTTLLAQADSCIGGKTSINFGEVKNKLGNFYPPSKIYIDTQFLDSLSAEDISSGLGEILHFYYYSNSPMTSALYDNYRSLMRERAGLRPYILESLRIKKSVIEVDEFDQNERNKFNYGHTFGHALESVTNYEIKHGLAVTVGMDIANMFSHFLGLMDEHTYRSIESKLRMNFPTYSFKTVDVESYIKLLSRDKKNVDDQLTCILSGGPGKLVKTRIPMDRTFAELLTVYFRSH